MKILIKKEAETDPKYGCKPEERPLKELINYGIININKSPGPTSHQISDYVKKILHIKKAGHSGTLDPNVTGVLPTALGDATRIVQILLKTGKEYVGLMHLHKKIPESEIKKQVEKFIGKIKQLPPIKSAIKRQLRIREIYELEIIEIKDQDILFRIKSEAGFYVRKFCFDFGKSLGTQAHMMQLIRTKVGPFTAENWHSLYDLKDAYEYYKEGKEAKLKKIIQPLEVVIQHLPKIYVFDTTVDSLCHGAYLSIPGISKLESEIKNGDTVAILTLKNELICLGDSLLTSEEIMKKEKGLAVATKKVFMSPNTYPKFFKISLENKQL